MRSTGWRTGPGFDRVSSDTALVNDIPYQVYDAAYMSDWWERTDCAMRTGQDC